MTATLTGADADLRKLIEYVEIHQDAGHADPSSPKFGKYLTDLQTLVDNAHRVIYANRPPATIDERLSFLVSTAAVIDRRTETFVSIADDLATAVATLGADSQAAADRVTADLAALRQQLADAATALQAAIDAGNADTATLTGVLSNVTAADAIVNSIDAATP